MWNVSWLKGRNNREKQTLPENYFKMIVVEVFTVVSAEAIKSDFLNVH